MEDNVLNPVLYSRLQDIFGSVLVAKKGEPISGEQVIMTSNGPRVQFAERGETYRVCCPFCKQVKASDSRHRLWINHRWGVGLDSSHPYSEIAGELLWLCKCYNEDCMARADNVQKLKTMVYSAIGRERRRQLIVADRAAPSTLNKEVRLPEDFVRLDQLHKQHIARQFMIERGFDPDEIGEEYGVGFCHESQQYPRAASRIIIPMYMEGKLITWQARVPYEFNWKQVKIPKYYNCPGASKRLVVYGYDQADEDVCIIVEGVTDVWSVGAGSVGLLGKEVSASQAERIIKKFKSAFLLLDSDVEDRVVNKAVLSFQSKIDLTVVMLPDGKDPADLGRESVLDLCLKARTSNSL